MEKPRVPSQQLPLASLPFQLLKAASQHTSQVLYACAAIALELAILDQVHREAQEDLARGANGYAATSAVYPLVLTVAYLVGVVFFGRRYFENREAWDDVDGFMIAYNAYQTAFNIWAVLGFLSEVARRGLPFAGTTYKPGLDEARLGFLIYAHYQNKFIELLDTVFMVVRKKNSQVSFLHVYHHTIMSWSWLLVLWYNPGGDAYFGALMNSAIHVVMYSYYLLSLLKIACPWKKFVTRLQLAQFAVIFVQGWYAIYLGSTPTWLTLVQQFVMVNMLYFFSQFYMQAYKDSQTPAAGAKKDE